MADNTKQDPVDPGTDGMDAEEDSIPKAPKPSSEQPDSGADAEKGAEKAPKPASEIPSEPVSKPTEPQAAEPVTVEVKQKPPSDVKYAPRQKIWTIDPHEGVDILMTESGIGSLEPLTVIDIFRKTVNEFSNTVAMCEKLNNEKLYTGFTYKQYWEMCWNAARSMRKIGFDVYRAVCIVGFNSHEWFVTCIASMIAGGMCAGVYTTNSPEACAYVARDCKAQLYFVEDDKQLQKIIQVRDQLPELKTIIQFKGELTVQHDDVMTWQQFLDKGTKSTSTEEKNEEDSIRGKDELDKELEDIVKDIRPERCALLIYTSGTTGNPKGVMLSHDNITFTTQALKRVNVTFTLGDEQSISYLPLSHIAAQLADIYIPIVTAATVWFAGKDALKGGLANTLQEVRPTFFFGVPRVWEKMEEKIKSGLSAATGYKAKIASWGMEKGKVGNANRQIDQPLPWGWFFANKLVFSKVRAKLGLDRCRLQLTGAAPISPQTLEFYSSIDIPLFELYGMSESTGVQVTNLPRVPLWKSGSVGKPYDGIEVAIYQPDADGNGEIITRGRHVFMGYLGLKEKTEQAIDENGWLHSEDIGKKDKEGFFYITGRIKELIITAGGENIPPVLIENSIKAELPFISNVMVIGDRRKFLSALITMQLVMDENSGYPTEQLSPLAREILGTFSCNAASVTEIIDDNKQHDVVFKAIQEGIDRANAMATSNAQRIAKWSLLDTDFSIPGGELGPTMKLKRGFVETKYKGTIDAFYAETAAP